MWAIARVGEGHDRALEEAGAQAPVDLLGLVVEAVAIARRLDAVDLGVRVVDLEVGRWCIIAGTTMTPLFPPMHAVDGRAARIAAIATAIGPSA